MALEVGKNSYVTVAEADMYFADRLFSEPWENAQSTLKAQALVTATSRVDTITFKGEKSGGATQLLQFPRKMYERDHGSYWYSRTGPVPYEVVDKTVPDDIKEAVFEEALTLLDIGNNHRIRLQEQGVTQINLGSGEQESFASGAMSLAKCKLYSPEARRLLRPYKVRGVSFTAPRGAVR